MLFAASAFLFLLPLAVAPHLVFYYDITPKVGLIFLAAAAGLTATFFRFDRLQSFIGTAFGRAYGIAGAASLLVAIATAAASNNPSIAWNGSNWRRYGAFTECAVIVSSLLLSAFVAGNPARLRAVLKSTCAAGLLASVYGIAQYFSWDPLLRPSVYQAGEDVFTIVRPPSTMGHADYFSAFLLVPVFAGIALAIEESRIFPKLVWIATTAAGVGAIVLSGSRGAVLALIAGLLVYCVLFRPRLRTMLAAMAFAAAALLVFYVSPAGARLRARVHWIGEDRAGGARLLLWRDSLRMAADKPLTGFGPDTFVAEFPRFQSAELARAYPDFMHESPHNILLDSLASQGVGGAAGLLAFAVIGILAGVKRAVPMPLKAGVLAGFVGVLIAHQFIAFTAPTAFYFYLGSGLLAGMYPHVDTRPAQLPFLRWLPLPGVLVAALAFRLLWADAQLADIDRLLDSGNLPGAAEQYRAVLQHNSAGVSADLHFARRFAEVAAKSTDLPSRIYFSQIATAAAALAAHEPEYRQNGLFMLAIFAASGLDASAVESALRATIGVGPNWYKPHWALARLLSAEGRLQEAQAEASLALQLNAGKNPDVAATFAALASSNAPLP
ncbi:MAG: O-antigen ligase family protein [Bryobacterales bacterium]|nr:O-antigen ligase family protein [Bryobacterales bacterium]MBV9398233.1 O-antigen ligase family protein [Bryobacterales bacterium]